MGKTDSQLGKVVDAILKILVWCIGVPVFAFVIGMVVGTNRFKQQSVDVGAGEWRADKQGNVQFHFIGEKKNVGQAK